MQFDRCQDYSKFLIFFLNSTENHLIAVKISKFLVQGKKEANINIFIGQFVLLWLIANKAVIIQWP